MDCTDIVIGMARGTNSRIGDFYTRDRSTPRPDHFWGGKNDLTAAIGFEKDGVTTILFRKKLTSMEPSDHSIVNDLMHVIWSKGQEPGKYVHIPKSGLERDRSVVKDFYRPDELKYHGHGSQRGQVSMNFYDEKHKETNDVRALDASICGGQWKQPKNCDPKKSNCEYYVQWNYARKTDEIRFSIQTTHTDTWTGIGFSKDQSMSQTDAIIGWVDKTGRPFMMDTWINGYNQPLLDASQSIYNISGRISEGATNLYFTRKRKSDDIKDFSFTDDECLYLMFPIKGGNFNSVNKKTRRHEIVPIVSTEKVCIRSCSNEAEDTSPIVQTTLPPQLTYNVAVKVINLGENYKAPKPGTQEFDDLSNTITKGFEDIVTKIPGYRKLIVADIEE